MNGIHKPGMKAPGMEGPVRMEPHLLDSSRMSCSDAAACCCRGGRATMRLPCTLGVSVHFISPTLCVCAFVYASKARIWCGDRITTTRVLPGSAGQMRLESPTKKFILAIRRYYPTGARPPGKRATVPWSGPFTSSLRTELRCCIASVRDGGMSRFIQELIHHLAWCGSATDTTRNVRMCGCNCFFPPFPTIRSKPCGMGRKHSPHITVHITRAHDLGSVNGWPSDRALRVDDECARKPRPGDD